MPLTLGQFCKLFRRVKAEADRPPPKILKKPTHGLKKYQPKPKHKGVTFDAFS